MSEPVWLEVAHVKWLHGEVVRLFGGRAGVRDEGILAGAVDRPQSPRGDGRPFFAIAAAYGFGLAKNHPFVDGNKRTALLAIRTFLFRNGYRFSPDEVETVTMIEGIASGAVSEGELAEWVESASVGR